MDTNEDTSKLSASTRLSATSHRCRHTVLTRTAYISTLSQGNPFFPEVASSQLFVHSNLKVTDMLGQLSRELQRLGTTGAPKGPVGQEELESHRTSPEKLIRTPQACV